MSKSFENVKGCSEGTLMIVDALNLAFRYLHARSTEFVDDYIRVVDSLKKSYKAGKVIIAADKGSSSYRKSIFPEYKSSRKTKYQNQTDEEKEQFEAFFKEFEKTLLQLSTIYPVLRYESVEADDIGAYIVSQMPKYPINEVWLITSDKDWDLLINEYTNRFSYVTRKEITYDNWSTHYDCSPEDYISIKCLTGDTGDSIPGVPGIGPKRAIDLVKEYGSALDIVAALPITSKYKHIQSLNGSKDIILRNFELMDLVTFCDTALGEHTKDIDKVLKEYLV